MRRPKFQGFIVDRIGDVHPYEIVEGVGPNGGQWMAREVTRHQPEYYVANSRQEAEQHAELSQG